jgi:hypothetical protein
LKALIIILAIVAVSFVALLVYGETRSEQPGAGKSDCPTFPKGFSAGKEPDEDDLSDWCPPKLAETTRGLQARFAPDLKLKKPATLSSVAMMNSAFPAPASTKKMRSARIELIKGDAAILADDQGKLCLCKPNTQMSALLFGDNCPDRWKKKHREGAGPGQKEICQPGDDKGILPVGGGAEPIYLLPQPPATVSIH